MSNQEKVIMKIKTNYNKFYKKNKLINSKTNFTVEN